MVSRQFLSKKCFVTSGFTLLELLSALLMVGILSAIATPSLLGIIHRSKVDNAATNLRGLMQVSQREAIKRSRECAIILPAKGTENPVIKSTCSVTGDRQLKDVAIQYNQSTQIKFTYKGGINLKRTIVIYSKHTNYKRCIVISYHIGMVREGEYHSNSVNSVAATHCKGKI